MLRMHKISQVSNEFIILLGMSFLFLLIFLSVISDEISSISFNKEYRSIKDLAFSVKHEIIIASEVMDGYERQFTLPSKVNGHDYSISNTNISIILVTTNKGIEQSHLIPAVNGTLVKGDNTIRRSGGVIYIN